MAIFKNQSKDILSKILIFSLLIFSFYTGWPQIWQNQLFPPKVEVAKAVDTVIFLTIADSSPWTVPLDWSDVNTIVAIGGGGGGGSTANGGGGGGGGEYSAITNYTNLTPGASVGFSVAATSSAQTNGNNTWFCNSQTSCANYTDTNVIVSAEGGARGNGSLAGGGGTGGVSADFAGGAGGVGSNAGDDASGGGGGAGSPNGIGGTGGRNDTDTAGEEASGGGGASGDDSGTTDNGADGTADGGAGGDSNGNSNSGGAGGTGNGNGQPGTDGGGGGGADGSAGQDGGLGGDGQEWTATSGRVRGAGGGGGGGEDTTGGVGGDGGSAGGGGGGGATGGAGAKGLIIITYTPNAVPTITVNDPDGVSDTVTAGDNYTVNYDLADTDNTVTANFAYDADTSGYDGTLIAGCIERGEGTNMNCTWSTTGVSPGTYYIHGTTTDGIALEAQDYSTGQVTVLSAASGAFDVYASSSASFNSALPVIFTAQTSTMTSVGGMKIIDDRGTSAGWTLNLTGSDWRASTEQIQFNYNGKGSDNGKGKLCAFPNGGSLYAESGSLTGVSKGGIDCFSSTLSTIDLVTATNGNGNGTYWLTDMKLEQYVPANATATVYTTSIIFTLQ
ncbi:MAG: hypothetical protein A2729_00990 [Candidatus Buchananbacteria bacterium RIFCSPHIGHO2_01_FULL_39_14]|uniref:Uncharacterized protein n=1 Tax=Candidatus Buchananbacteria bacterium RIFCSPHIGHO2_01_FULL_39_14 TaxID=1797532 RepID=A0A1G1XVR8_9BACT|nr:MAG: hypothetical protein A2729_00990 [Candidatus Buchananbacteria bacterium RIFCSPHIGHO2_01_FULL_39_14]